MASRAGLIAGAMALVAIVGAAGRADAAPQQPGPLTGVVRTAAGVPVASAVVSVVGATVPAVTTDATGGFTMPSVALPADLDVTAPGYVPTRVRITRTPAEIFVVAAGLTESVIVQAGFHDISSPGSG